MLMVREVSCQMWRAFSCAINEQSSVPLKRILWIITALWNLSSRTVACDMSSGSVFYGRSTARVVSVELLVAGCPSALLACLYLSFTQESSKHGHLLSLIHQSLS